MTDGPPPPQQLPPSGWYADPDEPADGRQRWWDGEMWQPRWRPTPSATSGTYEPISELGRRLRTLLVVSLVLGVVALVSTAVELRLLDQYIADPSAVPIGHLEGSDSRQAVIGVLEFLLFLGTGGVWLAWFQRLYRNTEALGVSDLPHSSGWAIGAWFVPILNLFRPKQIADALWQANDPDLPADVGARWRDLPVPTVVHLWWAAWVFSLLLGRVVLTFGRSGDPTLSEIRTSSALTLVLDAVDVLLIVVAGYVVTGLSDRQTERAGRIAHR